MTFKFSILILWQGQNLKLLSPKAIVKYSSFFVESLPAIQLKALDLKGVRSY